MSPAAAAAAATSFAAAATVASPAAPSRGCVRLPLRGGPAAPRRAVASMAVSTPRSAAASFLERRESERALHFVKYQGLGNDFIMVDNRDSSVPKVTPEEAAKLCDRNFGIGADGVIFVMPGSNGADYTMRIFNSDGSEPEMCGNGVCCFARFIAEVENLQGTHSFTIHTGAGLIIPEIQNDGQVKVDMGEPILSGPDIPTKLQATKNKAVVQAELEVEGMTWHVTCVSMGNPHCVTFGAKDLKVLQVDDLKLSELGPKFEHHEMFPARTNTEFVQVLSRSHLKMRVWERGAVVHREMEVDVCFGPAMMSTRKSLMAEGHVAATCDPIFKSNLAPVQTQATVEQAAEVQRRTSAEINNARCQEAYSWEADQL